MNDGPALGNDPDWLTTRSKDAVLDRTTGNLTDSVIPLLFAKR
jgi:hypothetical protein